MEPVSEEGSPQQASADGDLKTGPLRGVAGDSSSTAAVRRPKPARPALAGGPTALREGVAIASPPLRTASPEHAGSSESTGDRGRGARFNAVVDVVYYDSKQVHSRDEDLGTKDSLDPASKTRAASHEAEESSGGGFSDEGDELGSRPTLSSRRDGPWLLVSRRHTSDDAQEEADTFHLASDIESKDEPFSGSRFLPQWARRSVAYIATVNRDDLLEPLGPSHVLHRRFRSLKPLAFKRNKTETEFADVNVRKMPMHVVVGVFWVTIFYVIHFVTLHDVLDVPQLVLAEFVLSLLLILAMIVICLSYQFRRILEQALTTAIGVLFSLRAGVRIYVLAASLSKARLGTLGLFLYNLMGFTESLLLLIVPYRFAAVRYAFCFWLTCLTLLWSFAIGGLSAKVASDGYKAEEVGYSYWAPVFYVLLAGWVVALDYSCSMHEYKTRLAFWKLKVRRLAGSCLSGNLPNEFSEKAKSSVTHMLVPP
ncbi:hypothetical protein Emag_002572 [Eimeria magna]